MEPRQTQMRSGKKQLEGEVPPISGSTDNAAVHKTSKRREKDIRRTTDKGDISRSKRTATSNISESQSYVNHKGARKGEFRDMDTMYSGQKEITFIRRGNSKRKESSHGNENKSDGSRVAYRGENQDYADNAPIRSKASSMTVKDNGTGGHNELKPGEELTINTPVNFSYESETLKVTPQTRAQSKLRQDKTDVTNIYGSSDICLTDKPEKGTCRDNNIRGSLNYNQKLSGMSNTSFSGMKDRGECITCLDKTHIWKASCCSAEMCFPCLDIYVTAKVDDGMTDIKCPGSCCEKLLSSNLMKTIICPEKIKQIEYLRIKHEWYMKTCPFSNNVLDLEDLQCIEFPPDKLRCKGCARAWCGHCELPRNGKIKCEDCVDRETGIRKWAETTHKETRNGRQCPACRVSTCICKQNFVISANLTILILPS